MNMIDFNELRTIAHRIAPELESQPLYLVDGADLYPERFACAIAHRDGLATVRRFLEGTGEWCGPGPIISFLQPLSTLGRVAVLTHELAHVLPATPCADVPATDESIAKAANYIAFASDSAPDHPRWSPSHGREFVRILIHCWWRLAMHCEIVVPIQDTFHAHSYDLTCIQWYQVALGAEPIKMQHAGFAEIVATPEPEDFVGMWNADLNHWIETHPTEVQAITERVA